MAAELTIEEQRLASLMSDISEECWYAGWLSGLEYELWSLIVNGVPDEYAPGTGLSFGQCAKSEIEGMVKEIELLARSINRWIIYSDGEPELRSISLDEWEQVYQVACALRDAHDVERDR